MACAVLSRQARWPVRARKAGRGFLSSLSCSPAALAAALLCAWVLTSCSAAHVSPIAAPQPACTLGNSASLSPERLSEARELAQRLERGALHAALTQRYGPASGCSVEVTGPVLRVTELFRDGVSAELGGQQAIELSETRVVVRDVADADAVVLLKLAEQDAFGRNGCGINWDRPEAQPHEGPGSRQELVFRGPACQCQGRLGRSTDQVLVLILRATC